LESIRRVDAGILVARLAAGTSLAYGQYRLPSTISIRECPAIGSALHMRQCRLLRPVQPLSLLGGLRAPWLTLWDETAGRLVRFRDVEKAAA
jgi:hypothetical protein